MLSYNRENLKMKSKKKIKNHKSLKQNKGNYSIKKIESHLRKTFYGKKMLFRPDSSASIYGGASLDKENSEKVSEEQTIISPLNSKIKETIDSIMVSIKQELPEIENLNEIEKKLIKFTEDIKDPSDLLTKIKELSSLFNQRESSPIEKRGGYKRSPKNIKKTIIREKTIKSKKIFKNDIKTPKINQIAGYPQHEPNVKTSENESKEQQKESRPSVLLNEKQKKKIIQIITHKFKSLMTSEMTPKITEDISKHLKKLNPLNSLKDLFKQVTNVINGFRDSADSSLGVQFEVDNEFIILNEQKLEICKYLKKHGVRVDHGLLNYIQRNKGDIQGVIKDITYDFRIGQIKFDDKNVYWIPLEVGSKKDTQVLSGGTKRKKEYQLDNTIINSKKTIISGGNMYMWQILLPIYDNSTCELPVEKKGSKRSRPPPLNIRGKSGGGESPQKRFSFRKIRSPFAKKKKKPEVLNSFPGQKLKISGRSMRDAAKITITIFISLVKSMEKNTHFKFIYYFAINSMYKFIKSIKEIVKYSRTVNKNKKAARYLVYLGKLVCINTSNLFNIDLLNYLNYKLKLALDFYQLEALKDISELLRVGIEKIFDFNDQFCQYTSQLELKLSSESIPNEQDDLDQIKKKTEQVQETEQV